MAVFPEKNWSRSLRQVSVGLALEANGSVREMLIFQYTVSREKKCVCRCRGSGSPDISVQGSRLEELRRYLPTGESLLTVQVFSYSPLTSSGCPAGEWVGSGVGCHPPSSSPLLGTSAKVCVSPK